MALKKYNPTTPSQRGLVRVDKSDLWKGGPVKQLTEGISKTGGRNNRGRITSRHIVVVIKNSTDLLTLREISLIVWRPLNVLNTIQTERLI